MTTTVETSHQINLALRTAAGHARAANDAVTTADRQYEMKMKSAGASVWEAWTLAVRSQPEFTGRKLDDAAFVRVYESTKARPWWDRHLSTVKVEGKVATREWASRTLQWHTDPDAARARRTKDVAISAANYRKIKEKSAAHGRQRPQATAPTTAEMREVRMAAELGMGYGTQSAPARPGWTFEGGDRPTVIDRLIIRLRQAVGRLGRDEIKLAEAEEMLSLAAEGLEAL